MFKLFSTFDVFSCFFLVEALMYMFQPSMQLCVFPFSSVDRAFPIFDVCFNFAC